MWTRRKKQNLFYLLLGVLIGVAASCIVVSFQVIKRFTRENIAKWHEMRGRDTVQVVTYRPVPAARAVPAKEPAAADSLSTSDSLPSEGEEVILSDVRIASAQIQVPLLGADSSVTGRQALLVEQWENPMHFQGYRWDGQQLLVYGLNALAWRAIIIGNCKDNDMVNGKLSSRKFFHNCCIRSLPFRGSISFHRHIWSTAMQLAKERR